MNALISDAWAQSAPAAPGGQLQFVLLMVAFVALFYFMLIRPQQKRAREHQALVSKLTSGDEVVTSGGLLGRVTDVGDTFVTLEVADGVRVKVQKVQVTQLMPKGTLKSAKTMLEYARWKYILVAVVLLLALLFALPNVFGEDPALQVERKDHSPVTQDAAAAVESFLGE